MAQNTQLPPGTLARLHTLDTAPGDFRFLVTLAIPPAAPTLDLIPGTITATMTHDAGVDWPDAYGVALARGVLNSGGVSGSASCGCRTLDVASDGPGGRPDER